jgi:hypothetical protein
VTLLWAKELRLYRAPWHIGLALDHGRSGLFGSGSSRPGGTDAGGRPVIKRTRWSCR